LHPSFTIAPFTEALEEAYRTAPKQEDSAELEKFYHSINELLKPDLQLSPQFFGTVPAGSLNEAEISTEEIADKIISVFKELKVMLSENILELIAMESNLNKRLIGMKSILEEYYKKEVFPGTCEYLL